MTLDRELTLKASSRAIGCQKTRMDLLGWLPASCYRSIPHWLVYMYGHPHTHAVRFLFMIAIFNFFHIAVASDPYLCVKTHSEESKCLGGRPWTTISSTKLTTRPGVLSPKPYICFNHVCTYCVQIRP